MKKIQFFIVTLFISALGFGQTNNTYLGKNAGILNVGNNNTFLGAESGESNSNGNHNSFMGTRSGRYNTTGMSNTFVGAFSGLYNQTGNYNVFIGTNSGQKNIGGKNNSFIGYQSGYMNTSGNSNTFLGYVSGKDNATGSVNTFLGYASGSKNTEGSHNLYLGGFSGFLSTTGAYNTYIGKESGYSNVSGKNNVFLGYQAGYNETGSNKLYIANSSANTLVYGDFASGKVGIGTTSPQSTLAVNGTITTKEIEVTVDGWPDYVFEPNYPLLSLEEVASYIKKNKHLPNIPSEKEVLKEGVKLGEMNAKLLQKIEELTLYIIDLKREVEALKKGSTPLNKKAE